jgi:outer membrane lipoprotein-sorting protein
MCGSICVRSTAAIAACLMAWAAMAAEPELTSGRQVVMKAKNAVRAVPAIQYDADAVVGSKFVPELVRVKGPVTLDGGERKTPGRYRIEVHAKAVQPKAENDLIVAFDGNEATFIDHTVKTFARSAPGKAPPLAHLTTPAVIAEYFQSNPFQDELAGSLDLAGSEDVEGHACYKVNVRYERGGDAILWISKTDFLPRRITRFIGEGAQRISQTCTVTNLQPGVSVTDATFRLERPDGYADAETGPTSQPR